ncbi:MAG: YraN family protein [Ruminococcus sp.]
MKSVNTKATGNYGEELIVKFLKKKKYEISERNFSCKCGEIDIIAKNSKYIIFVEVKTRGENCLDSPALAVNAAKQNKILKTAAFYLMKHPVNLQPRFDVAEIYLYGAKQHKINYIENAFIQEGEYAAF